MENIYPIYLFFYTSVQYNLFLRRIKKKCITLIVKKRFLLTLLIRKNLL